jgi:hypothetical protein
VRFISRILLTLTALMVATIASPDAASSKKAFISSWEGSQVMVRRTLFSLVFDERSRVLPLMKRDGRVAGLTVVTPSDTYYQFQPDRERARAVRHERLTGFASAPGGSVNGSTGMRS